MFAFEGGSPVQRLRGAHAARRRPSEVVRDALLETPGRLGALLARPWVFWTAIGVFVALGVLFAVILKYPVVDGDGHVPYTGTIAPDEHRHIANILYYAQRPVTAGPVLHHIAPSDLAMGEMLRFPSYVYYYVMSFAVKPIINLGLPYSYIVVALRLVNVVVGAIGLIVTRRLLRTMGLSEAVAVLTVIMLIGTGRYVWQSSAVSYDAPSMTLFLCTLLYSARFLREPSWGSLAKAVVLSGWTVLFKYTFIPFAVVAIVVAVVLGLRRHGWHSLSTPLRGFVDAVRTRAVRTALWSVSFVLVAALVVERLGVNLVMYRAFNPDCSALHTHAQCMRFSIYARNFQATRSHELAQANGQSSSVPDLLEFAGRWATTYFQSVFFYRDRNSTWSVQPAVIVLGALVVVAAVVLTSAMVRSLFRTRALVWAVTVAGVYTVAMFVFNLRTLLTLDNEYAFSGRYMLPVLPLVYALLIVAALGAWRRLRNRWRTVLVVPVLLLGLVVVLLFSTPFAFFTYANSPDWYTNSALDLLPHWMTGVDDVVVPSAVQQ